MVNQHKKGDIGGIIIAMICVFHCVALPLFASSFSLFSASRIDNFYIDAILWLISFILGLRVLLPNYKKYHHNKIPLFLFILGILMFGIKDFYPSYFKYWWTLVALSSLILAHGINVVLTTKAINIKEKSIME